MYFPSSHLRQGDITASSPSNTLLRLATSTAAAANTAAPAKSSPIPIFRSMVGSHPIRRIQGYTPWSTTGIRSSIASVSNLVSVDPDDKRRGEEGGR